MFKLRYQIDKNNPVEEEYNSYDLISARIVELQDEFIASSTFSVMVHDTDNNLIQGANKT